MKKQMSKAFITKLQDKGQFNDNNYSSHMTGMKQKFERPKAQSANVSQGTYQSGKEGTTVPSSKSVERILRKRNANRSSGY